MADRPTLGPIERDRAAGVLVGAAVGDALGAGYEFAPLCPPEAVRMRAGTLTGRPAGSWTDDTDMTVCVVQAAAQGLDLASPEGLQAVANGFLRWYADKPPDIGNQTRAVLSPPSGAETLAARAAKYQRTHPDAAGNGSLMRTAPVALAHLGDDEGLARAARAVSSLTHPHDLAGDACVLWCVAIDRAVREGRLDGIREGLALLPADRRTYWDEALATAETAPIPSPRPNGFVVRALQAAWRAIVDTGVASSGPAHLDAALRAAVAIGDDTDTVAAIAGALMGGCYGASAVPFEWRRRLAGWPPSYGHRDLVTLGVLAATGGEPDPAGWPLADDLMPYYERHFAPSGVCVELPGRPGVLWGDIGALATADAQAFVSLCRIGTKQRRGAEHHEVWLIDNHQNADLAFVLADTADAVEQLRQEHGRVFVHCVRSESRTPTVATAWLMRHGGLGYVDAFNTVTAALPGCAPHSSLLAGLVSISHH